MLRAYAASTAIILTVCVVAAFCGAFMSLSNSELELQELIDKDKEVVSDRAWTPLYS